MQRPDLASILDRIAARGSDPVWISKLDRRDVLVRAKSSESAKGPLAGLPFAIKDNIDLAGLPTTAACPEFGARSQDFSLLPARYVDPAF